MIRINATGNAEVYFRSDVQTGEGGKREYEELSFSLEHFTKIASECWSTVDLRLKLIEEAQRNKWSVVARALRQEAEAQAVVEAQAEAGVEAGGLAAAVMAG